MQAGRADASCIKCVPRMTAFVEPLVFLPGRPSAQWTPDARTRSVRVSVNFVVRCNGGSISRWTHAFCSLNSLFFGKRTPVLANHPHFLPTKSGVLDRHAVVEQDLFRLIRARFLLSDCVLKTRAFLYTESVPRLTNTSANRSGQIRQLAPEGNRRDSDDIGVDH
jgi:hypothetical protein